MPQMRLPQVQEADDAPTRCGTGLLPYVPLHVYRLLPQTQRRVRIVSLGSLFFLFVVAVTLAGLAKAFWSCIDDCRDDIRMRKSTFGLTCVLASVSVLVLVSGWLYGQAFR